MEKYKYDVTIGIPVYGVEKYIRKCLESALSQTFKSIEFMMVDDRGPDKSVDIIRDLQDTHPRGKDIRIITQPQNMGCWAARNTILKEAQGEYIFFMDSDDYISSDCIKVLYEAAEKYHTEATYGSAQYINDAPSNRQIKYDFRLFEKKDEFGSYANMKFQPTVSNFIWNILIRTDFIRNNNLQFPKTKYWEDVLFNARFQSLITRAVLLPNFTYFYVIRENSLSCYENRNKIKIEEIRQHLYNCVYLNQQCKELTEKPYYEMRCAKELLQTFYAITSIIKKRDKITPKISNKELIKTMKHPATIMEILHFKRHRFANLAFYGLSCFPPSISMWLIKMMAKYKKLI